MFDLGRYSRLWGWGVCERDPPTPRTMGSLGSEIGHSQSGRAWLPGEERSRSDAGPSRRGSARPQAGVGVARVPAYVLSRAGAGAEARSGVPGALRLSAATGLSLGALVAQEALRGVKL